MMSQQKHERFKQLQRTHPRIRFLAWAVAHLGRVLHWESQRFKASKLAGAEAAVSSSTPSLILSHGVIVRGSSCYIGRLSNVEFSELVCILTTAPRILPSVLWITLSILSSLHNILECDSSKITTPHLPWLLHNFHNQYAVFNDAHSVHASTPFSTSSRSSVQWSGSASSDDWAIHHSLDLQCQVHGGSGKLNIRNPINRLASSPNLCILQGWKTKAWYALFAHVGHFNYNDVTFISALMSALARCLRMD